MTARKVGERIKIKSNDVTGTIVYAGKTDFAPGMWYGVVLDEIQDKNDGTGGQKQYFKCRSNCKIFVRESSLASIEVGSQLDPDNENIRYSSLAEMKLVVDAMNQKLEALKWEKMVRTLEEENSSLHGKLKTMQTKFLEQKNLVSKQREVIELSQKQLAQHDFYMDRISKLKRKLKWTMNEEDLLKKEKCECEDEVTRLSHLTELVVMEKEMCEENLERKESELSEAKAKIQQLECDLDIARADLEISFAEGMPTVHSIRSLRNENDKLNVTCSELECKLKLLLKTSSDELSKKDSDITSLEKVVKELKDENDAQQIEITELQKTIDAMSNAEELIEQMAFKNDSLEQEKEKLEKNMAELQQLCEVDIQLEETLQEMDSLSQQEVTAATSKLFHTEHLLERVLDTVKVQKTTISKFRNLVAELKNDKEVLQLKLQEAEMKMASSFQVNKIQSKSFHKAIQMENLKLEIELADEILQYWSYFLPDSFFAHGRESEVISVLVLFDKLFKKTNLLITQAKMKFPQLIDISKCDFSDFDSMESSVFGQEFLYRVYELRVLLRQLQVFINGCKDWELLSMGTLYSDLSKKSRSLDCYIDLFCRDKLDAQTNMGELKGLISCISLVFTCIEQEIEKFVLVADHMKLFETGCSLISFDLELTRTLLLHKFTANQVVSSSEDVRREIGAAVCEISHIKLHLAKGQGIFTSDAKCITLLKQVKQTMDKYVSTAHALRRCIMLSTPRVEKWTSTLRESYEQWNTDLKSVSDALLTFLKSLDTRKFDDFELELVPKDKRAICRRAKELRSNQDADLSRTRQMLEDSKLELLNLKKILKSKDEELSLTKTRADITARNLKQAMIRADEMQAEICKLSLERDSYKLQIEKATGVLREDWKQCLDTYRRENAELKARIFENSFSKLRPLQMYRTADAFNKEYIKELHEKTIQMKQRALEMSLPLVVDLTMKNYKQEFHRQASVRQYKAKKMQDDIYDLKAKLSDLKTTKSLR